MECSICFETNYGVINRCETPNCNCPICVKCWYRYYIGDVLTISEEQDDIKKCPYCRQSYWKLYMKDVVHCELIRKVLGDEALSEWIFKGSSDLWELLMHEE